MLNIQARHLFYYIIFLFFTIDISAHDIGAESSKDLWRKLWEDQISWMRSAMVAKIDDSVGEKVYKERLMKNSSDMNQELLGSYGEECAKLSSLISEHLEIADEVFKYVEARDIRALYYNYSIWHNNAQDIAQAMNRLNPNFWPTNDAEGMWKELLEALLAEATAHEKGNFQEEVAAHDLVHNKALEIADFFSSGITQQFPRSLE